MIDVEISIFESEKVLIGVYEGNLVLVLYWCGYADVYRNSVIEKLI